MYTRLLNYPLQQSKSFFLFGPRGVGKTTWLRQNIPDGLYFDLLKSSTYHKLLAEPDRLSALIPETFSNWIIIDEIQKVPALLDEIHRLIESRHYKFILTGSSARKLKKSGVNLLAGRARTYHMYPLTISELGDQFDLDQSLTYGHLPEAVASSDKKDFLYSYIQTYLKEEVQQEGLTRNLGHFARFLEAASFSQGQCLNVTQVAQEAAVTRKVAENYFSILEDLLLASRLPVFTKKAKRRMVSHAKFYYFDVGVYRTLRPRGPLDSPEEIEGSALESLVHQELKALNDYHGAPYTLYYWRTSNGQEVDFILYGEKGLIAIEVKRSCKLSRKELSGLKTFKTEYPIAQCYFFHGGNEREYIQDITVLPVHEALASLETLFFL